MSFNDEIKLTDLVFVGMPGSGKGTQAKFFSQKFAYEHISTGDLLRREISRGSDLGKRVKEVLATGGLVSDEMVLELLKQNTDIRNNKYVFDGFPRNIAQAKSFESYHSCKAFYIVYFKLDGKKVIERLSNRRMTADGRYIYNLLTSPPKQDGVCDVTGQKLIQREDDKVDVVTKRVKIFETETFPMLDHFKSSKFYHEINAEMSVEQVSNEINKIIS